MKKKNRRKVSIYQQKILGMQEKRTSLKEIELKKTIKTVKDRQKKKFAAAHSKAPFDCCSQLSMDGTHELPADG